MNRLAQAFALIDAANSLDPNMVTVAGSPFPAELVYGQRMTETLARIHPVASETLQLAVRAQHLRRWEIPRATYPMDRVGYLRWRNDLKRKHAEWAGELLAHAGYNDADIARTGALIRKENLRLDPEAQALEDTAALVFLEHYAPDFAAKHTPEKVTSILLKTLAKMSPNGRAKATHPPLPAAIAALVANLAAQLASDA